MRKPTAEELEGEAHWEKEVRRLRKEQEEKERRRKEELEDYEYED
jgi:hypothetical protein